MNLMDLFIKIGVDDQATSKIGKITNAVGKGISSAAKVGVAAIGTASAAIASLTALSINSFAEYEQLAGGAQKIFDQMDYAKIAKDADNAYKELGLSANQYLAVINDVGATFAATMGDEAGYEAAKKGLKAISDYASGTGKNVNELSQKFTLITRSTASYQSIADQFSGILPATSAQFLEQAQAAGILEESYTQLTEVPIDEYQAAVAQMLEKGVDQLGLANNTMNEAFSTLSGSLSMAKGAWSNLVTGIADDSANLDILIGNFVESVGAVAEQIIPKIRTALNGAAKLIRELIPTIVEEIPELIEENLPILAEAAVGVLQALIDGISENREMLFTSVFNTITYLANSFLTMLPQIVELGLQLIVSLANGIAESIPTLIPTIVSVITQIVQTLTNPETLTQLLNASIAIIMALAEYIVQPETINMLLDSAVAVIENLATFLIENLEPLLNAAIQIIMSLIDYILDPDNIAKLIDTAFKIVVTIAEGLVKAVGELIKAAGSLISRLIEKFKQTDWKALGKAIVDGIKTGIANAWEKVKSWFKGLLNDLVGAAKKVLGIASPSKVFKKIGGFTAEGFGIGFADEFDSIKDDIENAMAFDNLEVGANIHRSGSYGPVGGGNSFGDVIINIDGARYSDEKSLAEAVAEALQGLTERREAVYA